MYDIVLKKCFKIIIMFQPIYIDRYYFNIHRWIMIINFSHYCGQGELYWSATWSTYIIFAIDRKSIIQILMIKSDYSYNLLNTSWFLDYNLSAHSLFKQDLHNKQGLGNIRIPSGRSSCRPIGIAWHLTTVQSTVWNQTNRIAVRCEYVTKHF